MKIVHLTSVHPAFDPRIFHKECKTLSRAGHEVVLIACCDRDEVIDGVRIRALPTPKNRFERIIRTTWRVLRAALNEGADIYQFHDPELIPVGLLLRVSGKSVIYDVHEDVPEDILLRFWIPVRIRAVVSKIFRVFEDFSAGRFSGIIAATPYIRDRFLRNNKATIAVRNYPITDELYAQEYAWSAKELAVCYVGGISRERGIFELVESLRPAKVRLLLAGLCSEPILREQLGETPGWEMVDELGFVGRDEIANVLKRSLAGLVTLHATPKHIHSLPIKMFEYMSAAIPVIASDIPLWRDIIEGNQCGLCVDPMKPEEIARAIRYIVENPKRAQEMGENGRKAVLEKYCWDGEAQELLKFYARL